MANIDPSSLEKDKVMGITCHNPSQKGPAPHILINQMRTSYSGTSCGGCVCCEVSAK